MSHPVPLARHRARAPRRALFAFGVATAAVVLISTAVTVAARGGAEVSAASSVAVVAPPASIQALPVPVSSAMPKAVHLCELPPVIEAMAAGDDEGVVAASGGGAPFREAFTSGRASCVDLADPDAVWFVVNKARPFRQADWVPGDLVVVDGVRNPDGSSLDRNATIALESMAGAMEAEGVGSVSIASAYRSYQTQVANHAGQVAAQGDEANLSSARAGFSEHQTGLAVDLVGCGDGGCGSMDDFGASAQGQWVAAHGWRYGWIVRYESGQTPITGYEPEPWHLRYIGPELARAYHDGGFHTLEEFFALPAAPDYVG